MTDILQPEAYALTSATEGKKVPAPRAGRRIEPEATPSEVTVVSRTELTHGSVLEHYA